MAFFKTFLSSLMRRRTFEFHEYDNSELARVLTLFDLITLCVGSTLGLGVYVLAGAVAYKVAGPGVTLSFLIAGIASTFSGLCYAEFAARVPRAGSAYIYSYVTIGEFVAYTIGWNLVLEYVIGTAAVARGLSGYIDSLLSNEMSATINSTLHMEPDILGAHPDFLAAVFVCLLSILLATGVKVSSVMNIVLTVINLTTILIVLIAGSINIDVDNWFIPAERVPKGYGVGGFLPYGITGVFTGAAKCFFGFVGFDCIASTGEEALNPKRNIPFSIVISLTVIFLVYLSISTMLTMAIPYYEMDPHAPLIHIFALLEWHAIKWIVTIGAVFALCTSLLGSMFPLPRILYAMSSDRVIFYVLSKVNKRTKTPIRATILSGLMTGIMALIFDLDQLIDMMSIGTLTAYSIVAICVLLLRYQNEEMVHEPFTTATFFKLFCNCGYASQPTILSSSVVTFVTVLYASICLIWCSCAKAFELTTNDDAPLSECQGVVLIVIGVFLVLLIIVIACQPMDKPDLFFKVPLVPYIPCCSVFVNFYLMFQLDSLTWLRFLGWLGCGYLIYFGYGIWHSGQIQRDSIRNSLKLEESQRKG